MEMNWLAAAVATVVGLIVAWIWYGKVFDLPWRRLTGISPERLREVSGRRPQLILVLSVGLTAVGITAAVGIVEAVTGHDSVGIALAVGLVAWLTLSASTLVQHNAFEMKQAALTLINSAYQLVVFLGMALVAGLM